MELARGRMEGQLGWLLDGRAAALLAVMCVACGRVSSGFSAASVRPPIVVVVVFLAHCSKRAPCTVRVECEYVNALV